jgi:hypothetical protein
MEHWNLKIENDIPVAYYWGINEENIIIKVWVELGALRVNNYSSDCPNVMINLSVIKFVMGNK